MKDFKIDNKGTTQLFENRVLEGLTRTNFIFPVSFYYLLAGVFITFAILDEEIEHFRSAAPPHETCSRTRVRVGLGNLQIRGW